jgi:parallel beta-helix repeat protein
MKRTLILLSAMALVAVATQVHAASSSDTAAKPDYIPGDPKAVGGPDAYGYRYIDNLTGGGPTYSWIDTTSGAWTAVTGLGDDNAIGPFNLGFQFPYYWYRVSQFWIHSNGGISFALPARAWTPQNTGDNGFSNVNLPNDLIGAVGLDLDFTNAGRCRYRIRTAAPESLIVSWLGVYYWNTTNAYTFQLILAKADSSIRVQIRSVTSPPNGTGSLGIENMGGNVGLSYYNNGTPNGNRLSVNIPRAIRYYPPNTSAYTATDAGVIAVLNDQSGAAVQHTGDPLQPRATLRNFGTTNLTNLKTVCRIRNSANAIVYADSLMGLAIPKGQQLPVTFTASYMPAVNGTFRMVVRTYYAENPVNTLNDSIIVELPVVTYQQWAAYDDGTRDSWMSWSGTSATNPSGFGNYFELSRYPVVIDSVQAFVNSTAGTLRLTLYDTTGNNGGPGAAILDTTVTGITVSGWYKFGLAAKNITVSNGKFYVGLRTPTSGLQFGMDQTAPISRRTFEYTSGWTPYRSMETRDAMIRVNCHGSAVVPAFYVDSTAGSDANTGSSSAPFKTIGYALGRMALTTTDTIYIRNGTYNEAVSILPAHSGTASKRHVISAQSGQTPKIKANGAAATLVDSAASYVTIKGLTIYPGTGQMSAVLTEASNDSFCNNTVYTPTMGFSILVMSQTNSVIKGNRVLPIADNAYPAEGIYLYFSDGIVVDSNQVSGLIDAGIVLQNSDNARVCRNVVSQCMFGIDVNGSAGDSLYNNTFDGNTNSGIHVQDISGTLVIRNTNSTNNIYGICWDSTGAVSSDYNNIWNNTYNYKNPQTPGDTNVVAAGAHDISANPLYTAAYHLQSASPCRNAGTPVGLPYLGAAPDIGAYEDWAKFLDADGVYPAGLTSTLGLSQNHPNPFRQLTMINYQLAKPGLVSLKVYNIAGQLVRSLVCEVQSPGVHSVAWDGRDANGRPVSAGVYHYRLASGGQAQTRSLLYVK